MLEMCSRNESMLGGIPTGTNCFLLYQDETKNCDCKFDCECKINLIKKLCPYFDYIEDGLTKCLLMNITSDDDESFAEQIKICGFNELDNEIN